MKLAKKWNRRIFAAVLGTVVVGAPLFAVHADPTFSQEGEKYDVRRGMYEKEGGSDEHVRLGQYADEKHREARQEEQRADLEKRQAKEREEFEKRQAEERKDFEKQQSKENRNANEASSESKGEVKSEANAEQKEPREYYYDVRRGMYEKEGGSDTEVRLGMYEQPSEDGERPGLIR
jgi:hypothetical protein